MALADMEEEGLKGFFWGERESEKENRVSST